MLEGGSGFSERKSKLIQVADVKKSYVTEKVVVQALRGVTLQIEKGEFIAIMGPSGSGKSTLMNVLGCLDPPTEGNYILDGLDVRTLDDDELAKIRNQKIGFVFQSYNLISRHTALENVELPMLYAGFSNTGEKAMRALGEVGLSGRANHKPNELSGGECQRVAVARAFVLNPSIILADEPTGNLDSKTGNEIIHLLESLNKKGTTIAIVTHDPEIAERCQRIIYIRDGLIQKDTRQVN